MSKLRFYVSDAVETLIRLKAKQANLPLSKFLAELVKREALGANQWPEGYFALFDLWEGPPQDRPGDLTLELRESFD